jgi:hypothetical protein
MHDSFAFCCGVYGWRLGLDYGGIGVPVFEMFTILVHCWKREPWDFAFRVV